MGAAAEQGLTRFNSVGGIIFQPLVGWILDYFQHLGNKTLGNILLFVICGCAYLVAWLAMHLFAPKMKRVEIWYSLALDYIKK